MPVNIKLIRTKGILKMAVTEVLNFAVSKQALLEIAAQIERPSEYEIWVDSRESNTVLSMVNTDQLGEMLAVPPSLRESKITIVTSMDVTRQVGFLETIPVNRAVRETGLSVLKKPSPGLGSQKPLSAGDAGGIVTASV